MMLTGESHKKHCKNNRNKYKEFLKILSLML